MPRGLVLKFLSLMCAASLAFVLVGCGGDDDDDNNNVNRANVRVFNTTGGTFTASSGNTTLTGATGIGHGAFFPNSTGGYTQLGAGPFAVSGTGPGGSLNFSGNLRTGGFYTLVAAGAGTAAQPYQYFLVPSYNALSVSQGGLGPIQSGRVAVRIVNLSTGNDTGIALYSAGAGGALGTPFNTQFGTGFNFGFSPITTANQFLAIDPALLTNLQIVSTATVPPTVLATVPPFPGSAGQAWTLYVTGSTNVGGTVQAVWVRDVVTQWTL